jgi:hypothetical protein
LTVSLRDIRLKVRQELQAKQEQRAKQVLQAQQEQQVLPETAPLSLIHQAYL